MKSEHKRVKHGELPGDISRWAKIAMREKKAPFFYFPWQEINKNCAKAFRKYIQEKGRAVQRRRDKRAIQEGLDEDGLC